MAMVERDINSIIVFICLKWRSIQLYLAYVCPLLTADLQEYINYYLGSEAIDRTYYCIPVLFSIRLNLQGQLFVKFHTLIHGRLRTIFIN